MKGLPEFLPLDSMTVEHYANTVDIDVRGTAFTVQKAAPLLNEGASVVLSGSTSTTNGTAGFSVCAASKAAGRSFGRTWAAELAGRNIRVNTLIPDLTETPGIVRLAANPEEAAGLPADARFRRAHEAHGSARRNRQRRALPRQRPEQQYDRQRIFVDGGDTQI
jgi:NAD(P)-dependent dehydrogenase (short-subunit alcohol dehydrogenase family)